MLAATDFDLLNAFAANARWDLLFDLNVLLRSRGRWDPRNAIEILKYSIEQNYTNNLAFELGNGTCVEISLFLCIVLCVKIYCSDE